MGGLSNRITSTNFEFLKLDWDLQNEYYGRSKYIEDFFVSGDYISVLEQADKFEEENVGVISRWDEEKIIQDVLANNIYVIAKTPMAKTITQRTLAGYKNWKTNISYIPDIVNEIKDDLDKAVEKVQMLLEVKL